MLAWATATFWFPLMVAIGIWRHVINRVPLRYHPSYWALVFPLGMYGAATFRMRAAVGLDALAWLPKATLAVALAAWTAAFLGLLVEGARAVSRSGGVPADPGRPAVVPEQVPARTGRRSPDVLTPRRRIGTKGSVDPRLSDSR